MHANGNSAIAEWPTPVATGTLPEGVGWPGHISAMHGQLGRLSKREQLCGLLMLALPPPGHLVGWHTNRHSCRRKPLAAGLPVAVTLGTITLGTSNVSVRFTHAPWYSQEVQARVRVWNPVGSGGKLLADGKEFEEFPSAGVGIIPQLASFLLKCTSAGT